MFHGNEKEYIPAKCPRPPAAPTTTTQFPGRIFAFSTAYYFLAENAFSLFKPLTYLISRQPSTEYRPHNDRINIIRQHSQIIRVKSNIFLKAAILMMQMIRTLHAILFRPRKTKLAPSTNPTRETNPNKPTNLNTSSVRDIRTQRDNPSDSLVATDVRQFYLRDRVPIWSGCGAGSGV